METLRIGIIGTGLMGAGHARYISNGIRGAELVAIADVNEEGARNLAAEVGVEKIFTDGKEMINSDDVDAVIIATPDPFHAQAVLDCIKAGKPVLCEKPLAPTVEECKVIMEAEAKLDHPLVTVGFMRRFDPSYREMKKRLQEGRDGALLMTHSTHRNVSAYPGQDSSATITNSGIHEIDILPWLSGNHIAKVQWQAGVASKICTERHDPQFLLMTDTAGVLHTVELQVHSQYGYDVRCEMVCEKASVEMPRVPALLDGNTVLVSTNLTASYEYPVDHQPRFTASYCNELTAWVAATLKGELPEDGATARDSLRATIVGECLVQSMNEGGVPVEVPSVESVL